MLDKTVYLDLVEQMIKSLQHCEQEHKGNVVAKMVSSVLKSIKNLQANLPSLGACELTKLIQLKELPQSLGGVLCRALPVTRTGEFSVMRWYVKESFPLVDFEYTLADLLSKDSERISFNGVLEVLSDVPFIAGQIVGDSFHALTEQLREFKDQCYRASLEGSSHFQRHPSPDGVTATTLLDYVKSGSKSPTTPAIVPA